MNTGSGLGFISMPVEHLRVTFKPNNFFKWSPAIDVPAQEDSHSTLAFGLGSVPVEAASVTAATNGTNGHHATTTEGEAASSCGCH